MNSYTDKTRLVQNVSAIQLAASPSALPLQDNRPKSVIQKKQVEAMGNGNPTQNKPNNTGLPDLLKTGIESLSGRSMDDVKVHYNSDKPAQLSAFAYAQGTDIHIAGGQEKHLPHEAWHVVQQKQGRVRPTLQMKGAAINDNRGLEQEADMMGQRSLRFKPGYPVQRAALCAPCTPVIQRFGWGEILGTLALGGLAVAGASGYLTSLYRRFAGGGNNQQQVQYPHQPVNGPYQQSTDPTLTPFLGHHQDYISDDAANMQMHNQTPSAAQVRVDAVPLQQGQGGAGLHEIIPTNYRQYIRNNPALVGAQSGARTSTAYTLMTQEYRNQTREVSGHTGFFDTGRGATVGQADAHEHLRQGVINLVQNPPVHQDEVVNEMINRHIKTQPTGEEVLASQNIVGRTPRAGGIGMIEPLGNNNNRPNAVELAQQQERGRERVKRRTRTAKRYYNRGRSPSPPRRRIENDGTGGGYIPNPLPDDEVEAMPQIAADPNVSYSGAANLSAWITQPQRDGF